MSRFSTLLAESTTLAPLSASIWAKVTPRPEEAPVITAVLSLTLNIGS
ncbi:uncharacterized protein METZ01_LOCUS503750 [marine metagenome]|uniref:Uncharacterized protein n=1 Tax=marine metagenome TaxID=408172 RepID=A0A383E255_9ZZZZ